MLTTLTSAPGPVPAPTARKSAGELAADEYQHACDEQVVDANRVAARLR